MRYEFEAPSHHLLVIGGEEYHGGDIVELDESVAAGLSENLKPVGDEAEEPSSGESSSPSTPPQAPGSRGNPIGVRTST